MAHAIGAFGRRGMSTVTRGSVMESRSPHLTQQFSCTDDRSCGITTRETKTDEEYENSNGVEREAGRGGKLKRERFTKHK